MSSLNIIDKISARMGHQLVIIMSKTMKLASLLRKAKILFVTPEANYVPRICKNELLL
jgi:hypothetical protein